MAGCECDKETWKLSYDDVVESVKATSPDLSPRDVRREAAQLFRPRYRSDKASIARESSNESVYDTELTFTIRGDGSLIYTNSGYEGVEIEDFSKNQLQYKPKSYSLRDHQTSIAIKESFIGGATRVVSAYYRDGNDNRDILEMRYDPSTHIGKIFVINTTDNGKYHGFSSLVEIAKRRFSEHHEVSPADGIFLLTDKRIGEEQLKITVEKRTDRPSVSVPVDRGTVPLPVQDDHRNIRQDTTFFQREKTIDTTSGKQTPDWRQAIVQSETKRLHQQIIPTVESIAHRAVRDTKIGVVAAGRFAVETIKRKRHKPEVIINKTASRIENVILKEKKPAKQERILFEHSSIEQPVKRISSTVKEKMVAVALIPETAKFDLGFAVLSTLAKETPARRHRMKHAERLPGRKERKQLRSRTELKRTRKKESRRTVSEHVVSRAHRSELGKQKRKEVRRGRLRLKNKETSRRPELRPRKERRRIAGREKKMTVEPIHLRPIEKKRVGKVIERFMNVIAKRETPKKKRNDHQKTPEKIRRLNKEFVIPVVRVAFGTALFLLLRQTDTKPQKNSRLSLEMKKRELPQKEETQWILLSIVWYLAMIRESGMRNSKGGRQYQKRRLPVRGVIFVANS